jgi:signal transduction histidine kinase
MAENPAVRSGPSAGRWSDALDRWVLVPILVGLLFAAIQTIHVFRMFRYGLDGVVLEAALPLVLAVGLGATGPWLRRRGYHVGERRRVVGWMAVVAAAVGLLFGWALSHQFVLGYPFRHWPFVVTTNLIAGSLLGLFVGVYDVRSRRHRRTVEAERETVARQRARLSVLNRVLRHNIRNDAAVVMGITENLAERTSGEAAELADSAAAKTGELVGLGEKAREIEAVTDVDADAFEPVDLASPVATVVEAHGESGDGGSDDVAFDVDVPADLRVVTAERVLYSVLEELVGNAVEHADGTPVRVEISATPADEGRVELVVADDGPGIPSHELAALEQGVETALDHGSGLGLRLVSWGVSTLGGELSFDESAWGGTAVRVVLPRAGALAGRSTGVDRRAAVGERQR